MARIKGPDKKIRRYDAFCYSAKSWKVERARIEASSKGADSRFVVT